MAAQSVAVRFGHAIYSLYPLSRVGAMSVNELYIFHCTETGQDASSTPVTCKLGSEPGKLTVQVNLDDLVENVVLFGRFLNLSAQPLQRETQATNTLQRMMAAAREIRRPPKLNESTGRERMFNKIIDVLEEEGVGWSGHGAEGEKFVAILRNALWQIDPHVKQRNVSVPTLFRGLQGFNTPEAHGHKVQRLTVDSLKRTIDSLSVQLDKPWINTPPWDAVRMAIESVLGQIDKVSKAMQKDANRQAEIRTLTAPTENTVTKLLKKIPLSEASDTETSIAAALADKNAYEKIEISDLLPTDKLARHRFMKSLRDNKGGLPTETQTMLQSHSMASHTETLHFLWLTEEPHDLDKQRAVQDECKEEVPRFHSRLLKRKFKEVASTLGISSCKSRLLYALASDDSSAANSAPAAALDQRLQEYIDMGDESLIYDLRALNSSPERFNEFFNAAQKVIAGVDTAVDDRRHDPIVHMAVAMSAADLYKQVQASCPEAPAPSLEWFRLQFYPRHSNYKSSARYTGKLEVKHMVQQRQLRATHPDEHYCNAVFRYLKEFSIHHGARLFSLDDKCKIPLGEPGKPIAAVARGKQVLVGLHDRFLVTDHDFSRSSLIPSVSLMIDVPSDIGGSWYQGTPYVCMKDAVFEASSPNRHAAELIALVRRLPENPVLCIYTDGGPDHRCNYLSVIVSMVYIFFELDLDMLILARNAPGHSWRNPAERIMSQLNLALQAVGMMRETAQDGMEEKVLRCNSMKQLRAEAEKTPEFKASFTKSLEHPTELVNRLFQRLSWGDQSFKVEEAATREAVAEVAEKLSTCFNEDIPANETRANLHRHPNLSNFLDDHTVQTKYFLSIKKCGGDCAWCSAPVGDNFHELRHLPVPEVSGDHYVSYQEAMILCADNTQPPVSVPREDLPSERERSKKYKDIDPKIKATVQNALCVRRFIRCLECGKPRVIHAKNKIGRSLPALDRELEGMDFTCGTNLREMIEDESSRNHILLKVSMRLFECGDPVETAYGSSGIFPALPDVSDF